MPSMQASLLLAGQAANKHTITLLEASQSGKLKAKINPTHHMLV